MDLKARAAAARRDTYALYLACRDPRVGWPAKALGVAVVAYALSPIDLIPDFIPVLGYLDDLLILPLGVAAVRRLIPDEIFDEHRRNASERIASGGRAALIAAAVIVVIWVTALALLVYALLR